MSPRSESANKEIREKRKKAILEAAITVFADHGFHSATISSIAKQAGISKGLVYSYFESKEDLLYSLVEGFLNESEQFIASILAAETIKDKIICLLNISFDYIEQNPRYMRLFLSLAVQPEATQVIKDLADSRTLEMINYFEHLMQESGLQAPREEIYILSAALDGIALHYLFFEGSPEYPWEGIKKTFIDNTLNHFGL